MINQSELKKYLKYDLDTGEWTWIKRTSPFSNLIQIDQKAGCMRKDGRIDITLFGKRYLLHRLAFLYVKGYFPKEVDHIDGNPQNNSWNNLRECTHSQNRANSKIRSDNSSGYTGVYWHKVANKWRAACKGKSLGCFSNKTDAIAAYEASAAIEFGEFKRR